ncbi:MAG: KH domain-containing protein [Chlamydiales bacterium]|nr:KH domain-containing protein [Chlamydiales bacterium]
MKEFVEYLIKNLVDEPNCVSVKCFEGERGIIVEVSVAQKDIGKVVGRHGNTIKSLRTIISAVSARLGKHVRLELIEPGAEATPEPAV